MANQTSVIEQKPLETVTPVGQDIMFVISNDTAVANETRVKFIAEVHISTSPPNVSTATDLVATFKTTPNNAGVGIFNFRSILENYVSADNMAANNSKYKTTTTSDVERHPLHIINQYSKSKNIVRYLALQFKVEFLGADTTQPNNVNIAVGTAQNSDLYIIENGYIKYTDELTHGITPNVNDFGFDLFQYKPVPTFPTVNTFKFLTNAPTTLYANLEDYGTFAFLQTSQTLATNVNHMRLDYYKADGSSLGNEAIVKDFSTGAFDVWSAEAKKQVLYFGAFPGNLQNSSSTFQALVSAGTIQGGYYTVIARNSSNLPVLQTYTINVTCPDSKGFESIRLCWLNQWGAWDYYTFTKKSVRSLTTQGTTYNQLEGSWNESKYRINSYKGGKKAFRVNSTERISMNTDFVSADFNITFEELINSPEVYMLDGYQTDSVGSALNQYVTPVRLTTSSFTKKTIANDKLIQYTFEVEKSKTLRTQAV